MQCFDWPDVFPLGLVNDSHHWKVKYFALQRLSRSCSTHLNHIQTNVLVERIKNEFSQALVTPCSMNKK